MPRVFSGMHGKPHVSLASISTGIKTGGLLHSAWHGHLETDCLATELSANPQPLHVMKIDSEAPPSRNQMENYRRPIRIRNHERLHKIALHRMLCGDAIDAGDAFTLACGLGGVSDKRRIIPRLP